MKLPIAIMAEHPKLTPTASSEMMQPTSMSSRNKLTNGAINNLKKSSRTRSKSESHHPSTDKQKELYGVVVRSAKDRAHDRKPKNMKGSGKPKKGSIFLISKDLKKFYHSYINFEFLSINFILFSFPHLLFIVNFLQIIVVY